MRILKNNQMILLALTITIFTPSCSKEEEKEEVTTVLSGTWASDCQAEEEGQSSRRETSVFTGTTKTSTQQSYNNATCTDTPMYTVVETYNYTIGDDVAGITDGKQLDLSLVDVSVTLNTDVAVTIFKENSMCGITDWALNTTRSVIGYTCGQNDAFTVGLMEHTIFQITGSELLYGAKTEDLDGKTAAKRPTAISPQDKYTKQ